MTIKQRITEQLKKVLEALHIPDIEVKVEYPSDPKHGDYATNVALVAFKRRKGKGERGTDYASPMELAEHIAKGLEQRDESSLLEKIEVVRPGFINFWVKDDAFIESLSWIESIMKKSVLSGKRIVVEYTDPNPFKELHIGHLYSNIIGESLCLLFEANGATVWRADYFGDVGMHVAKSIWGLREKLMASDTNFHSIADLEREPLEERVKFLGEGYAFGSNKYAESEAVQAEVKYLNKLVYLVAQQMWEREKGIKPQIDYRKGDEIDEKELDEVYQLYVFGRKWSLESFEELYQRLGTTFDGYYPESIAGEKGYRIVRENISNGIFVESEGAIIFPGESQGLHNRVFINKLGLPTYEAKELGLPEWKYEDFAYDVSYIVTANEIAGYFCVLVEALKKVQPDLGYKTHPVLHGMVRLPEGKMSSRSGNIITVAGLLDEAKNRIQKEHTEISDEVAEMVGKAAVKYAFLRSSVGKDITFDIDESISLEGNSGPYIQYTYARTQSVLRKMPNVKLQMPKKENLDSFSIGHLSLGIEERELLLLLSRFPEIVEEAAVRLAPHVLCTYLFEVAQSFNQFYQSCPVINAKEEKTRALRLLLTAKTGELMRRGLSLLGIQSPEKM